MPDKMWQIDSFTGTEEEVKAKGNELGRHGWELVSSYPAPGRSIHDKPCVTAWFKREIPQERIAVAPEILDSLQSAKQHSVGDTIIEEAESNMPARREDIERLKEELDGFHQSDLSLQEVFGHALGNVLIATQPVKGDQQAGADDTPPATNTSSAPEGHDFLRREDMVDLSAQPPVYAEPEALDGNLHHPELFTRPATALPEGLRDHC